MSLEAVLVLRAADGSSLVLGEDPADRQRPFRLVFEHEGHGPPVPVSGRLTALWLTVDDRSHVVFAGNSRDEPRVERVLVDLGDRQQTCRLRPAPHNPRVWMTFPEPFEPGMVVTAWWLGEDRVYRKDQTPPLEWGMRVPEPPPSPPEAKPLPPPEGGTRYAPRE